MHVCSPTSTLWTVIITKREMDTLSPAQTRGKFPDLHSFVKWDSQYGLSEVAQWHSKLSISLWHEHPLWTPPCALVLHF